MKAPKSITPSWFTGPRRQAAYRIAAAAVGIASVYGLVNGEQAAAVGFLFAALFGIAQDNTPPA